MDWNRNPILLVEDNAGDADLTLMALNRQGLGKRVVHMRDGVDALDYLHRRGVHQDNRDQSPVVMFLDLKMPMFDGFAVIREVRASERLRHIPIVVLTASNEPGDRQRAYAEGANAYLCKPVDFVEFMETMRCTCQFWIQLNQRAEPS